MRLPFAGYRNYPETESQHQRRSAGLYWLSQCAPIVILRDIAGTAVDRWVDQTVRGWE
jgi:hypothetical protein